MKSWILILCGLGLMCMVGCTPDSPVLPFSKKVLKGNDAGNLSQVSPGVAGFSATVVLHSIYDSAEVFPAPIPIFVFDLAEITAAGSYESEYYALDSHVGISWTKTLSHAQYRFEVFEGSVVLPSGQEFHYGNAHVDFSLEDWNPHQYLDLFVDAVLE